MNITARLKPILLLASTLLLACPAVAMADEAPVKEILTSHIGWDVNKTKTEHGAPQSERNICTIASKDECQAATPSDETGVFQYADGVAVNNAPAVVSPEHGDVYVADQSNHRVQVFSTAGEFVLMFGWNVNKTKIEAGAPQNERNVCTAESKDVCQAGTEGSAAGQFLLPHSVAVDPATGNVFVEEYLSWRVQEFTATGEFVLMIGKDVNETTGGNLCTGASKDKCKTGERASENSTEPGAFDFAFAQSAGDLLAIGGPKDQLYVGDHHRVQIFNANGTSEGEIPLASISSDERSAVIGVAVDATGDVYLVYSVHVPPSEYFVQNVVREFNAAGSENHSFSLPGRQPEAFGNRIAIEAIAIDPAGRLAISEIESGFYAKAFDVSRGGLYEVHGPSLDLLTEFSNGFSHPGAIGPADSLAFDAEGDMYSVGGSYELDSYRPERVGAVAALPAVCAPGVSMESDATVECGLKGEVNPWGVSGTSVWFQWGSTTSLGLATPREPVPTKEESIDATRALTGLLPNETYDYRLVGEDENVVAPELLASPQLSVTTASVPPRIVGEPSVPYAGPFSAVMFGEVNPENTNTSYRFQYGACENLEECPELLETPVAQSPSYGPIGSTVEVRGLLPETVYHYRLMANNQHETGGKTEGGEATSVTGTFTTAQGPAVSVETGGVNSIGATSAVVSGVVNPDGQAAGYVFELGRYAGSATQFGVVFSGSAGAGTTPVQESLGLSGLQPGTTYAYRIAARSGDGSAKGQAATGQTQTFTTQGLPAVLNIPSPLVQLPVPNVAFPPQVAGPSIKAKSAPKKKKKNKTAGRKKKGKKAGKAAVAPRKGLSAK